MDGKADNVGLASGYSDVYARQIWRAHARGLGDMDFQRKKVRIFWQFLGHFVPFFG